MTDIKLFTFKNGLAAEISGQSAALEKSLQQQIEANLETLLGVRLLSSEYATGPKHGGRIDTLGIDENMNPVIIEYKRATNENVINQGLFYLDWLLDHRAEFKLLVLDKLGTEQAKSIDWSAPRLVCIAGGFTKYDEHAVQQMNRNIELIRYRRFGDPLLMLELVNAIVAKTPDSGSPDVPKTDKKTIEQHLDTLDSSLQDLYHALRSHLMALGDDVQKKDLKYYVAFKRLMNFACVEVHPNKEKVTVFLRVNPDSITLQKGFTRDVRKIGHYGTGDLEVTLRNLEDVERAHQLLQRSYDNS